MNDIEIALEDLDTLVEIARQHTGIALWLGLVQSALIMKEALEKQIPEKPYYLNYGGYNVGNWNHGIACICDYKAPYCGYCGQKLDWSVENE